MVSVKFRFLKRVLLEHKCLLFILAFIFVFTANFWVLGKISNKYGIPDMLYQLNEMLSKRNNHNDSKNGNYLRDNICETAILERSLRKFSLLMDTNYSQDYKGNNSLCPSRPSGLIGRRKPSQVPVDPNVLAVSLFSVLEEGGHYKPKTCIPVQNTAIIIPFRDRMVHLNTLMPVLIPMLIRQNVEFTVFVIEQDMPSTFNKGLMFNVGFLEALKLNNFDCFILHDVDMLPADDRNMYRCHPESPVHLVSSLDKFGYKLLYDGLFGGVVAFTLEQYKKINGASNMYFGWGAEDDDLRDRAINKNLTLVRKHPDTAVYDMIAHGSKEAGWKQNADRFFVYGPRLKRQDIDGLNSAMYTISNITYMPLYTWINVAVDEKKVLATVPRHLRRGKHPDRNYVGALMKYITD